jgi:hypothetical protein
MTDREYLGDGVFAEFDGYQIWVAANNGYEDYARVALETQTMRALDSYRKRLNEKYSVKHL